MGTQRIGLLLEPLDVLFFRDGRPFEAGMRATGGLPLPQTLAGALRTQLWRRLTCKGGFEAMQEALLRHGGDAGTAAEDALGIPPWGARMEIAGPWLYVSDDVRVRTDRDALLPPGPLVPAPTDLVREKGDEGGNLQRLHPLLEPKILPGWRGPPDAKELRPLWLKERGDFEPARGFLSMEGLKAYLKGGVPDKRHVISGDCLYVDEDRIGIAVDPDMFRAADHLLYSVRFLRLRPGVAFYAEVRFGEAAPADAASYLEGVLAWGGEGRRVRLLALREPEGWPAATESEERSLALSVTPGIFHTMGSGPAWRPDAEKLPRLVAAAVPGSVPVSGWDLARKQPKPTRHAVAAGSIYCFAGPLPRTDDGNPFVKLAQPDPALAGLGYGLALRGVWKHVE